MENQKNIFHTLTTRRIGIMLPLGFASGLPLAITGKTLQSWLTEEQIALGTIGIFTLVGVPYTFKFLWAPIMDRFVPPWLGRRRAWMLLTQLALLAGIGAMGLHGPSDSLLVLWTFGALALFVAFTSASQDIAFDAYRADLLKPAERGFGAAVSVNSYRLAMMTSGAFAFILSDLIGFRSTYFLMAALMLIGVAATLFGPEPDTPVQSPKTLRQAYQGPLEEFFSRPHAVWILVLVILYKMGDAFAGTLTTAFLQGEIGFSRTELGVWDHGLGLGATILGAFVGGAWMVRLGLFRALLLFGILQAVTNLSFMAVATVGKSLPLMVVAVAFENLAGGMGTIAFVAFLMSLCDSRYTATQYALLSALAAIGRVFVGTPSGFLVDEVGWVVFFFLTFLAALPGLWLLWRFRETINRISMENT